MTAAGPECTCTELQRMTVCHDIRNEPHLVGCPRWGTPKPGSCRNCACPWDSCLIHSEFCCDACAHFDPEDPLAEEAS